jgi:hypothetical protein
MDNLFIGLPGAITCNPVRWIRTHKSTAKMLSFRFSKCYLYHAREREWEDYERLRRSLADDGIDI